MPLHNLLITYELGGRGREAAEGAALRRRIGAWGSWAQVTECTYIVQTEDPPEQVRDALLRTLNDGEDRLFVVALANAAAWHNVICPSTWLKGHL